MNETMPDTLIFSKGLITPLKTIPETYLFELHHDDGTPNVRMTLSRPAMEQMGQGQGVPIYRWEQYFMGEWVKFVLHPWKRPKYPFHIRRWFNPKGMERG